MLSYFGIWRAGRQCTRRWPAPPGWLSPMRSATGTRPPQGWQRCWRCRPTLVHRLRVPEQGGIIARGRSQGDLRRTYLAAAGPWRAGHACRPARADGAAGAVRVHRQLGPLAPGRRAELRRSRLVSPLISRPSRSLARTIENDGLGRKVGRSALLTSRDRLPRLRKRQPDPRVKVRRLPGAQSRSSGEGFPGPWPGGHLPRGDAGSRRRGRAAAHLRRPSRGSGSVTGPDRRRGCFHGELLLLTVGCWWCGGRRACSGRCTGRRAASWCRPAWDRCLSFPGKGTCCRRPCCIHRSAMWPWVPS
jgi:hypothetical protein